MHDGDDGRRPSGQGWRQRSKDHSQPADAPAQDDGQQKQGQRNRKKGRRPSDDQHHGQPYYYPSAPYPSPLAGYRGVPAAAIGILPHAPVMAHHGALGYPQQAVLIQSPVAPLHAPVPRKGKKGGKGGGAWGAGGPQVMAPMIPVVPQVPPPPPPQQQQQVQQQQQQQQARAGGQAAGAGGASAAQERKKEAAKKKIDITIPQYPASRIVLLRRVTWEATQGLLEDKGKVFGTVLRVIMLRSKNHALIEFSALEEAQKMVDFYKEHHGSLIDIAGHPATIGYCKHQKWVAPEASRTLLASLFDSSHRITECMFISPRVIYQLFSPYGAVEAVIVLPKKPAKNRVQALVQFAQTEQAKQVKEKLQGLPVWFGGKVQLALDLLFSKVESISSQLLPGSTMLLPREVVEVHDRLIQKHGSLLAFNKPVAQLSPDELEDFEDLRTVMAAAGTVQRKQLEPAMAKLEGLDKAELQSGDRFAEVLADLHKPIADDWCAAHDITPEKQQLALRSMENLIHNGGMAATCRLVPREDGRGDDDDDDDDDDEEDEAKVGSVGGVLERIGKVKREHVIAASAPVHMDPYHPIGFSQSVENAPVVRPKNKAYGKSLATPGMENSYEDFSGEEDEGGDELMT